MIPQIKTSAKKNKKMNIFFTGMFNGVGVGGGVEFLVKVDVRQMQYNM